MIYLKNSLTTLILIFSGEEIHLILFAFPL